MFKKSKKFILIFLATIFALSFFGTALGVKTVSAVTIQGKNFEHTYFARVNVGSDDLVTHYYTENDVPKTRLFDANSAVKEDGFPGPICTIDLTTSPDCGFKIYAISGYNLDPFAGLFKGGYFYGVYDYLRTDGNNPVSSNKIFDKNKGSSDPYILFLNTITQNTGIINKPISSPTNTPSTTTCLDPTLCVKENPQPSTPPATTTNPSGNPIPPPLSDIGSLPAPFKAEAAEINAAILCADELSLHEENASLDPTTYLPTEGACKNRPDWFDDKKPFTESMVDVQGKIATLISDANKSTTLTTAQKKIITDAKTTWDAQIKNVTIRPTSAVPSPSLAGTATPSGSALYKCEGSGENKKCACTAAPLSGGVDQLIEPFPGAIVCFLEGAVLGGIKWGFSVIQPTFANILNVDSQSLSDNPVVKQVSNLFVVFINSLFLLVALLSILVTTLKIPIPGLSLDSWQLKRMIPTIIATMILVNYSLSIVNLIIEIMNYLVTAFMGTAVGDGSQFFNFGTGMYTANSSIGALAVRIVALLAFLIVIFYLICVLWIRKIMLIVFYMFAPVPYLTNIIPVDAVKKITSKYWEPFMNWAFMGPMVAILLRAAAEAIRATTDFSQNLGALPIKETGGVGESGGLSLTSMILVGVLLYLAATMPLKLGGAIMASVQKATTSKAGKAAAGVAKSAKEGVVKTAKTAAYKAAAGEGRLGKIPGVKGLVGAAITAKRTPEMLKAKQDAKLAEAKEEADKKLAQGKITQRMTEKPLVKDEVDKAQEKNKDLAPQQVMNNIADALKKGQKDKAAGALKALQSQSKSLDNTVRDAALEQIKQLNTVTGGAVDLSDPSKSVDNALVNSGVGWARKASTTDIDNLKREKYKGGSVGVISDFSDPGFKASDALAKMNDDDIERAYNTINSSPAGATRTAALTKINDVKTQRMNNLTAGQGAMLEESINNPILTNPQRSQVKTREQDRVWRAAALVGSGDLETARSVLEATLKKDMKGVTEAQMKAIITARQKALDNINP